MRLKSIRLRPGEVRGPREPGKGLRVCGCGTKDRGRGRAVGISWMKQKKGDREPRGPKGGDALVGCVVRQVSRFPWPHSAFSSEIYLQGCIKPLVSISPNDR